VNLNSILQDIEAYLPLTLKAIVAVEQTVTAEKAGASKKQVVLDIVQTAAKVAEGVPVAPVAALGAITDAVVGILNSTGLFSHSPAAPAPTPTPAPAA
jgi:hypothetical protein